MDCLIPARIPDLVLINQKKRTCLVDFTMLTDHRVKIKEREKDRQIPGLVRELKKLWNIRVTVTPILIGVLRTVLKDLKERLEELEIRERIETIPTTALLRMTRLLR